MKNKTPILLLITCSGLSEAKPSYIVKSLPGVGNLGVSISNNGRMLVQSSGTGYWTWSGTSWSYFNVGSILTGINDSGDMVG